MDQGRETLGKVAKTPSIPIGKLKGEQIEEVLATLTERQQKILRLQFGLDDGRSRTFQEIGQEVGVTRERIRQIECKAMRILRHPSRARKLTSYLDEKTSEGITASDKLLRAIFGE